MTPSSVSGLTDSFQTAMNPLWMAPVAYSMKKDPSSTEGKSGLRAVNTTEEFNAADYLSVAIARKLKWMGRWQSVGILAMIVSITGFYKDSPKVGNIAFVIMTFSLFMSIFMLVNINWLEIRLTHHEELMNRDEEV